MDGPWCPAAPRYVRPSPDTLQLVASFLQFLLMSQDEGFLPMLQSLFYREKSTRSQMQPLIRMRLSSVPTCGSRWQTAALPMPNYSSSSHTYEEALKCPVYINAALCIRSYSWVYAALQHQTCSPSFPRNFEVKSTKVVHSNLGITLVGVVWLWSGVLGVRFDSLE